MSIEKNACAHYKVSKFASPRVSKCEECGVDAPIRVCLECGHVGCCDSTRGHATAHAKASGHPVIRQLPIKDASFTWCYVCNDYLR
jgi:CPA1 family monovalent cation:H+ antiporter